MQTFCASKKTKSARAGTARLRQFHDVGVVAGLCDQPQLEVTGSLVAAARTCGQNAEPRCSSLGSRADRPPP